MHFLGELISRLKTSNISVLQMFTLGLDTSDIGAFRLSEAIQKRLCALFWSTYFSLSAAGLSIYKSKLGLLSGIPGTHGWLTPAQDSL